jgi:hypothetical protein
MADLLVPVSVGELVDKITILRIKERHIRAVDKLANVRIELAALVKVCELNGVALDQASVHELEAINQKLWDIEDAIRDKEAAKAFDDEFIALARSVYQTNDIRAAIKSRINVAAGSRLREEKSYRDYQ